MRIYSVGSAWFSQEENEKGRIMSGQLADFVLLSKDYMTVPAEEIKSIESVLTVVDGKPVYAGEPYQYLAPTSLREAIPAWSPVTVFPSFHSTH